MMPSQLGPYEVLRLLGKGGMGEVYLARDPRLGREVTLKVLPAELRESAQRRQRLLQEARAAAALNHPSITTIYEVGTADGQDYIAFEYVEGETLAEHLRKEELSAERVLDIGLSIAEALHYAHAKGIVHRDLKPSNVMISDLGLVKILDFGLAKQMTAASESSNASTVDRLTDAGVVVGTVAHMSPEQALGKPVDGRSDVFSYGSLLYEMAAGKPAFTGDTTTEVLDAVLHVEPPSLSTLRPELPDELTGVVEKALRKDLVERYQSMADVAADLRHVKRRESDELVERPPTRRRAAPMVAVALALAGILALVVWRSNTARAPRGSVAEQAEEWTESVDALRAFRRGETLLRRLDFPEALESFREAFELDPEFAMAHYRHSMVASWAGDEDGARESGVSALTLIDRAPDRYRGIIRANSLFVRELYTEAIPLVEAVLEEDPDNVEALYYLNEFVAHQARDPDPRRGAELLERILEVNSGHPVVNLELPLTYGCIGGFRKAWDALDRLEPTDPIVMQDARALITAFEGDIGEALRLTERPGSLFGVIWRPTWAALASRWDLEKEIQIVPLGNLQGFLLAGRLTGTGDFFATRGRFEEAIGGYRKSADTAVFQEGEGLATGVPATALISLAELLALRDSDAAMAHMERALDLQPQSPRGHYFAAWFGLRLQGDVATAKRHLERLAQMAAGASGPSAPTYRDALEAEIALVDGDTSRAISILERIAVQSHFFDFMATFSSAGAVFQEALARAYMAANDNPKAVGALETLIGSGVERASHPAIYVKALYRLGLLQIELGRDVEGRRNLERFLEHWGNADWDLPEVADARERLAR